MIAATRRSFARALLLALCLGSLAPAAALAAAAPSSTGSNSGSGAFEPGLPQSSATVPTQTATTPPVVVSTSSSSSATFTGTDALLVALGAIAILAGIAYFIWSDSRHHVRRAAAAGTTPAGTGRGSKAAPKSRKLTPAERRRRKRGRAR
jgi:hypothetical protein